MIPILDALQLTCQDARYIVNNPHKAHKIQKRCEAVAMRIASIASGILSSMCFIPTCSSLASLSIATLPFGMITTLLATIAYDAWICSTNISSSNQHIIPSPSKAFHRVRAKISDIPPELCGTLAAKKLYKWYFGLS